MTAAERDALDELFQRIRETQSAFWDALRLFEEAAADTGYDGIELDSNTDFLDIELEDALTMTEEETR
jgi:hypothetical protein